MSRVSFQSEQPSELDLFPGSSHDKVANAMCTYIVDDRNSRVIGLDGEFGSGKSSILTMLKNKLVKTNPKYKIWFFDCEQNYQGSIKSNFIELFTDELINSVGKDNKVKESLLENRDKALGRHFTYTKSTVSRISSWALLLIVALFFSTSSFKELFALSKLKDPISLWLYVVHIFSFFSPVIVLLIAFFKLKGTKVGEQQWSIFHLFKGGSDDTVTEKIQVAREVSPLDLKHTLDADLKLLNDIHYVVILDNLDRLPKDSLRTVWSDLEIFTWVSEDNTLTVIVPFCSNKVAKYLAPDHERTYDSRDFIAKKFPVVFRAPPIIASGWKDGFYKLWESTFPEEQREMAEKCAMLLQRHSPMNGKLVTPRLQKRFINDIATTSLTLGSEIDLVCIGAHLLLCKYSDLPLEEMIRVDGASEAYKSQHSSFNNNDLKATQQFLESYIGSELEKGWQIQILQVHFLTSSKIAMAELIDEPLAMSIEELDSERFATLVTVFGFKDAFKRYLSTGTYNSNLVRVLGGASEKLSNEEFTFVISLLNKENRIFHGGIGEDEKDFYQSLKVCRLAGLNTNSLNILKKEMATNIKKDTNEFIEPDSFDECRAQLIQYDALLDALAAAPDTINVNNASYFAHIFVECKDLKVIGIDYFKFTNTGIKSIHKHIVALPNSPEVAPISEAQRGFLLKKLTSTRKFGNEPVVSMAKEEILSLSNSLRTYPNSEAILFGLVLSGTTDSTILAQVINQPFEGRTISQNAAVAVLLMVSKSFKELARIENLETVVESTVFKLLFRGAGYSDVLTSGLDEPNVGGIIAKVLAWAIKDDVVWKLNHGQVSNNFTKLTGAVEPYGVDAQLVFQWLDAWGQHFKANFKLLDALDVEFVRDLTDSSETLFSALKAGTFNYYSTDECSEEDWESILLSQSLNHGILIEYLKKQNDFTLGATCRPAIVRVIQKIITEDLDKVVISNLVGNFKTLLTVCNQQQKNLLGNEFRNLVYLKDSVPSSVVWLLDNFGYLIVDIQPANTLEVGKLMEILEYVSQNPQESTKVCTYLDERARQISSYPYSEELREAMAVSIASLVSLTPKLYKSFAKKAYFKRVFNEIFSADKNKANEVLEPDE